MTGRGLRLEWNRKRVIAFVFWSVDVCLSPWWSIRRWSVVLGMQFCYLDLITVLKGGVEVNIVGVPLIDRGTIHVFNELKFLLTSYKIRFADF